MPVSAIVICDSINETYQRLTTFQLRYPKFIHGEFMTHRMISRNASSSRAVPTAKLIEEVRSDARAAPVEWGKNQLGMQASSNHDEGILLDADNSGPGYSYTADEAWAEAANSAAYFAEKFAEAGYHKQVVNRILEPYTHINVVATATEWDNFFGLRLHKDADPTMQALAKAMWTARESSEPRPLVTGDWHLPYCAYEDNKANSQALNLVRQGLTSYTEEELMIRCSVARCARVSYNSFDTGKRSTIEEDLKLYNKLISAQPLHASPAEHQATPDTINHNMHKLIGYKNGDRGSPIVDIQWVHDYEHGNFIGFRQYRKMLPNEEVAPLPEGY